MSALESSRLPHPFLAFPFTVDLSTWPQLQGKLEAPKCPRVFSVLKSDSDRASSHKKPEECVFAQLLYQVRLAISLAHRFVWNVVKFLRQV